MTTTSTAPLAADTCLISRFETGMANYLVQFKEIASRREHGNMPMVW
jgi:hypothetical protein